MTSTWTDLAVIGVGETAAVKRSDVGLADMVMDTVDAAIADAGLKPTEIDGIVVEGGMMGSTIRPHDVADLLGVPDHTLTVQVSVGGAGNVGAPVLAAAMIRSGLATNVLTYFGADYGSRPGGQMEYHATDPVKPTLENPYGFAGQATYFGAWAERYRHEFGLEAEQLGSLAVSTRRWAAMHPTALKRETMTMADYLDSPLIADPLRVLDCCLINDGAAAYITTAAERAKDHPQPPVYVRGCSLAHDAPVSTHSYFSQLPDLFDMPARLSSERAMAMAGVSIDDIDVAEVYDCFTISCILQLETLGFCGRGEGAAFVADGRTGPGGSLPMNTHGGLLSNSYMVGAGHLIEAVHQLRNDAGERQVSADVALVAGFSSWDHATAILTR